MSDLVKSDEDQVKILKQAGILRDPRSKTKRKHILFASSSEEGRVIRALHSFANSNLASLLSRRGKEKAPVPILEQEQEEDLGWKSTVPKKTSSAVEPTQPEDQETQHLDRRKHLLQELSARLDRDRKLRHAQREFEMQRLMMGKGARRKIQAVEKVDDHKDDDEEDQDEIDAQRGKRRSRAPSMNEEIYRPRVYKWRLERKK
jgi:U3 small nucleolar RNA-associated protein 11